MDLKYDRKFEEMKQYIPFLESMIKRLENTSSASANPRQAQLDKIRSLRDLLLDKKKRMKMENLLKCEQVLVNLYAKVEQRDTLPGIKALDSTFSSDNKDNSDLNEVRNKFKSVTSKIKQPEAVPETLPEIARASETEEVCTPGSKEPALFQRRPNKSSISPSKPTKKSSHKSVPKRSYTRVLVSPEHSSRRWTAGDDTSSEKPLFSRRSPRRSPRRFSPSYHKKERKKSSNSNIKPKDLNITLNVPEESLSSLNTEDILSRIINCSDNDVDIHTLRDLRSQILGELKQTGASEDISDLIMKSYKKKKSKQVKQKTEIEEGELSDSESEAIESIYGSLVLVDKDKNISSDVKASTSKEKQPRKIQICLVINSDKEGQSVDKDKNRAPSVVEISDLEMYDDNDPGKNTEETRKETSFFNEKEHIVEVESEEKSLDIQDSLTPKPVRVNTKSQEVITIEDDEEIKKYNSALKIETSKCNQDSGSRIDNSLDACQQSIAEKTAQEINKVVPFKANFYKPLNEQESENTQLVSKNKELHTNATSLGLDTIKSQEMNNDIASPKSNQQIDASNNVDTESNSKSLNSSIQDPRENVEIPLLNLEPTIPTLPAKKREVSEIDILQALKNEILSDSIAIPGAETAPPLHQPKITKVASAQEIIRKKRISIEKYKEKSVTSNKASIFMYDLNVSTSKEDSSKKQSLKLTEKECERFNLPNKLSLDQSSDEEDIDTNISIDDIYENLAPKSPENEDINSSGSTPPIIIPIDPIKTAVVSSKVDVDMRQLMSFSSQSITNEVSSPLAPNDTVPELAKPEKSERSYRPPPVDPRVRREFNKTILDSPNSHSINPERTPRSSLNYPNSTPSRTPSMTSNMTPNARTYEMTPSQQSFDEDDNSTRKHVYAPMFPAFDNDRREMSVGREIQRAPHWETNNHSPEGRNSRFEPPENRDSKWEPRDRGTSLQRENSSDYQNSRYKDSKSRNQRYNSSLDKRDDYSYSRSDCPRTPIHSFGRLDCPSTPTPSFGRLDTPMTPVHPFGRSEGPTTPNHPFGRSDCPSTPSHPFGRSERPMTPSHPFGRSEAPMTPSHPFGRSEGPMTPSHSFGRSEAPMTPNHPFGRTEAPRTPSHHFGRCEAPMTPSHPFGRSEMNVALMTPSHTFGRSEYSNSSAGGKYAKDPRINRSNDYESGYNKYDDDRDRNYHKDRRGDISNRSHNTDSYRNFGREQNIGITDRTYDKTGRSYKDPMCRESSGISKDYEDQLYTRERGRHRPNNYNFDRNSRGYNEVSSRTYQRASSIGRTMSTDDRNRGYVDNSNDNTLSVKPQSGRSFTIDTSVNRTFQEFLNEKGMQVFDYSFNARRQRATSVGRSLVRENSVARTFRESSVGRTQYKLTQQPERSDLKIRNNFTRARSMGRDMAEYKDDRSFKDIKAEFQAYSANSKKKDNTHMFKPKERINYHESRSKKDIEVHKRSLPTTTKPAYSPRKNNRDPRLRREQNNYYKHRSDDWSRGQKTDGIVYSNDNIARGTILGSGFGVKNYKIPKIKRSTEEKCKEETVSDQKELESIAVKLEGKKEKGTNNKLTKDVKAPFTEIDKKQSKTSKKIYDTKELAEDDDTAKRSTNVSKNKISNSDAKATENEGRMKLRKHKKAIISDSDSDSGSSKKEQKKKHSKSADISKKISSTVKAASSTDKQTSSTDTETVSKNTIDSFKSTQKINTEDDLLDTSFGIDDIEIFHDDNINALIADLDNDIEDSKNDKSNKFTNEITLENILDSISSPEDKERTVEESLNDLTDLINEDLKLAPNDTGNEKPKVILDNITTKIIETVQATKENSKISECVTNVSVSNNNLTESSDKKLYDKPILDKDEEANIQNLVENSQPSNTNKVDSVYDIDKFNNDAIVSTTEIDLRQKTEQEESHDKSVDPSSTPDSTINLNENITKICTEALPDSTNEIQNEMNSDISSTHEQTDKSSANVIEPPSLKTNHEIGSINNLLSILQDKTKIKELLSMLGDQTNENEKIKKKLEKLSEIVSDDEDTNEGQEIPIEKKEAPEGTEISKTNTNSEKQLIENTEKKSTDEKVEEVEEQNAEDEDSIKCDDADDASDLSVTTNKSRKVPKRRKKSGKWKAEKKSITDKNKRLTRADISNTRVDKPKASRELKQLQEDIKEMFLSDVVNATGIRMCRLAKLVDDRNRKPDELIVNESKPVVLLEKFKEDKILKDFPQKIKKKPGPKPKIKIPIITKVAVGQGEEKTPIPRKHKPGPKSRTRILNQELSDPYVFQSDTISESNTKEMNINESSTSSESDNESLASSKSFGSSEALAELKKKPKRKRRGWQSGVIKPKKRKKIESKPTDTLDDNILEPQKNITIPDMNCFTDKKYCFLKNVSIYSCRLCEYNGAEIVHHYKMRHPHSEIPLSRMDSHIARKAIEQCEELNFQAISKMSTEKYICTFCFKEFNNTRKCSYILETFFWHIVSTHTGEYKQLCSECINVTRCPFNLDIPPPPKDVKGQLIGYICGKCNFTQISLENLKTHVIVRHNDEQTEVYTINLAVMTRKSIQILSKHNNVEEQSRVLRSSRSTQSVVEASDDRSDITESTDRLSDIDSVKRKSAKEPVSCTVAKSKANIQSKITFEYEDNVSTSDLSNIANAETGTVKTENDDNEVELDNLEASDGCKLSDTEEPNQQTQISDILNVPHFKIRYINSGAKEYVCCINGNDNHYNTTLLISMKRHVQTKHKENWDGYCYVCKVIVTTQGIHNFKECLQHLLDQHIDNFPVLESISENSNVTETSRDKPQHETATPVNLPNNSVLTPNLSTGSSVTSTITPDTLVVTPDTLMVTSVTAVGTVTEKSVSPKAYINVRSLSELISTEDNSEKCSKGIPKIQSVVSLSTSIIKPSLPSTSHTVSETVTTEIQANTFTSVTPIAPPDAQKPYLYEEAQAEVMSKKNQAVLHTMMARDKLLKIFKCAGRYCSFSTDSAEDALLHVSTHQRIGGENALICAYCDFDCSGNAIDLITHVYKHHGRCQFLCGHCFYRAAASQLVRAHMIRVHGEAVAQEVVLKTETVVELGKDDVSVLLTREAAVQYYVCVDAESNCKFKTYTQGKFCEHLLKHSAPYKCYICSNGFLSPTELINHMKSHELRLFQCTWCVYGAENEAELLAHASSRHPCQQPQAYLRVITSKEGSSKMMVLPLAQYNKSIVPTEVVTSAPNNGNPVREAERSMELEKLIGSMLKMTSGATLEEGSELVPESNLLSSDELLLQNELLTEATDSLIPELPRPSTPQASSVDDDISQLLIPVLKVERPDPPTNIDTSNDDVICLDSDEEDSTQNVIDLSDDDISSGQSTAVSSDQDHKKIVPVKNLFKCPNSTCTSVYKKINYFKRHVETVCFRTEGSIKCGHCSLVLNSREELYTHYEKDHGQRKKDPQTREHLNRNILCTPQLETFLCDYCSLKDRSFKNIKKHIKLEHLISNVTVTSKVTVDKELMYVVREASKPEEVLSPQIRQTPKRKLSSGSMVDTPTKKKRFGPQDVDQLPTKQILDELVYCALCEFSSKVRINLVRHLQCHAEKQPVPQTVPVNPVPHLESNEKHFDKMVNLASSSIVTRAPDKTTRADSAPVVNLLIPPEAASRYPKYIPERQRLTCGAKGCSYISLDEEMLKRHWETLHAGSNDYHCVHCPPHQHLDTSRPLTAMRVIAHLKMHEARLYACSLCSYYHYRKLVVEKHLSETHKDPGQVLLVRDEVAAVPVGTTVNQPPIVAPTMDLKPWQCGMCKFKSMLRQEVIEHCAKNHNSKMQFKCPNCPFRTSTFENVTKHQSNSHPESTEEVLFYYYREGSIPDEPDGTPRWMKQRQRMGNIDPEVKAEVPDNTLPNTPVEPVPIPPISVNLNLVKQEVIDPETEETIEELCKLFGQFCDPNGLNFKCPLCKVVVEDTKEAMQSHLYEELQYRKWGCSICTYKAFHTKGLSEHMKSEHRQHRGAIELPIDTRIEKWVSKLLQHQAALIEKTKENFAKQKIVTEKRSLPSASKSQEKPTTAACAKSIAELENAFGNLGDASDMNFCCPKCNFKVADEQIMQDHLESELNRIRWQCSNCMEKYQEYHEAQLHCKSLHPGQSARPVEALRDPATRAAWVAAVLRTQKQTMNLPESTNTDFVEMSVPPTIENPLLVERFEVRVPTPEVEMLVKRKRPAPVQTSTQSDSEDERLVIDEPGTSAQEPVKTVDMKKCPYCEYSSKYKQSLNDHILRHYNLKPFTCNLCGYTSHLKSTYKHKHSEIFKFVKTIIPTGPPPNKSLMNKTKKLPSRVEDDASNSEESKLICLVCEKSMSETESQAHSHGPKTPCFAKKGQVVVKCCNCLVLVPDVENIHEHHMRCHPSLKINYAYHKLLYDSRESLACGHCDLRFKFLRDLKSHHNAVHSALQLKYTKLSESIEFHEESTSKEKVSSEITVPVKRVARKSTSKLPSQSVAKKSTSKLPFFNDSGLDNSEEYSYYGTKPTSFDELSNVTTLMPFCNTMMPFTLRKLNEIIKINPRVIVERYKK